MFYSIFVVYALAIFTFLPSSVFFLKIFSLQIVSLNSIGMFMVLIIFITFVFQIFFLKFIASLMKSNAFSSSGASAGNSFDHDSSGDDDGDGSGDDDDDGKVGIQFMFMLEHDSGDAGPIHSIKFNQLSNNNINELFKEASQLNCKVCSGINNDYLIFGYASQLQDLLKFIDVNFPQLDKTVSFLDEAGVLSYYKKIRFSTMSKLLDYINKGEVEGFTDTLVIETRFLDCALIVTPKNSGDEFLIVAFLENE